MCGEEDWNNRVHVGSSKEDGGGGLPSVGWLAVAPLEANELLLRMLMMTTPMADGRISWRRGRRRYVDLIA